MSADSMAADHRKCRFIGIHWYWSSEKGRHCHSARGSSSVVLITMIVRSGKVVVVVVVVVVVAVVVVAVVVVAVVVVAVVVVAVVVVVVVVCLFQNMTIISCNILTLEITWFGAFDSCARFFQSALN